MGDDRAEHGGADGSKNDHMRLAPPFHVAEEEGNGPLGKYRKVYQDQNSPRSTSPPLPLTTCDRSFGSHSDY